MNSFSLSPVLMLNAMNSIAVAIVFVHFWWLDRRNTAAIYWASGFLLLGVRQSILAVILGASPPRIVALVAELFLPALEFAFVSGTYLLTDRPIPYRTLALAFGALGAVIVAAYAGDVPDVIFLGIGIWGSVVAAAMVGRAFVVFGRQYPGVGHGVIGYLFYGWATAIVLANIGRSTPGLLPGYYLVQPVLTIAVGLALFITIQRRQQAAMAKAEEGVRINEALLRRIVAALDLSGHGLVLEGADGKIIYANGTAGNLLGNRASVLEFLEKAGVAAHIRESGSWSGTVTQSGSDGREMILNVRSEWLPDGGLMTLLEDQTEQIAREGREAILTRQLEQSQKMEALGKLTGGMAHDFNNYLGIIIGNLDLLSENESINSESAKLLDTALQGALSAAQLTQSLLAFSRQQPLAPQRIEVGRNLEAVAALLRHTIGEDITLTTTVAPGLWPVRIDAAQLDSCVLNLANNARDAMPKGGTLSISATNAALDARYVETHPEVVPGDYVLIAVSDTGAGMSAETLARVFEPFFTTKPAGHGTGLGLSMVYGFIKQSEGHVTIYSEVGHGAVVRLYLPRDRDAKHKAAAVSDVGAAAPAVGTETILVVEDKEWMRRTVAQQLTSLGYRVIEAQDGAAALAILGKNNPPIDLLFTDIVMPGNLDGYELAKRAVKRRPVIKILLTSGFPGDAFKRYRSHMAALRLLNKPYRMSDLERAIRVALDSAPVTLE